MWTANALCEPPADGYRLVVVEKVTKEAELCSCEKPLEPKFGVVAFLKTGDATGVSTSENGVPKPRDIIIISGRDH